MKKIFILPLLMLCMALGATAQEYKFHTYAPNDGGIFLNMSANGQWGVIRLGNSQGGGTALPKYYEVATDKVSPIAISGYAFDIQDISDDGNIVVGSYKGMPASYNRKTRALTQFPVRKNWMGGTLSDVTPDGKWAVGQYVGYTQVVEGAEVPQDYFFSTLMVNVETGDTIATPGLPAKDMNHENLMATIFNQISPDGQNIIGSMSWFYMQPIGACRFLYNVKTHTYKMLGFEEHPTAPWTPVIPGLHHIEDAMFSPDGKLIGGTAYMAKSRDDGTEFANEYVIPFVMNVETGETNFLDDSESVNISMGCIDNQGTIFGNPESGGPLRNFRILYKGKFWITFSQLLQQYYKVNFTEKTGFEFTGTAIAVSGDGRYASVFSDPNGESYIFDFGTSVEEACSHIDLLSGYTASPEAGSAFSKFSTIEVNFGRAIQILGKGNTHVHIYNSKGEKVRDGLSTADGIKFKGDSKNIVELHFRSTTLEPGETYYLTIDKGAVATAADASMVNGEIRIPYVGRADGPVSVVKTTPASGASLRQIDNGSSYINIAFDCPIQLTSNYDAYLVRVEDNTRIATLNVTAGFTEETRNQIVILAPSTVYLYKDQPYKVVLAAGSVTDRLGTPESANKQIEITYNGSYVREVTNSSVLFEDNFNNPNESLMLWLQYEGDHNTPVEDMTSYFGFDTDNTPWNFSVHDDEYSPDYFAASNTWYTNEGTSDDWMMTPQIKLPNDPTYKVMLEFDAQKWLNTADDKLKIYIYENSRVLSMPLDKIMKSIKLDATLLDEISLEAGPTANVEGEWTHYKYDLSAWAGKDIYVCFVNQNGPESLVFVDNVCVQREVLYTIGFSNQERVKGLTKMDIAGTFTVEYPEFKGGNATLTLKDAQGNAISTVTMNGLTTADLHKKMEFAFDKPLPLTVGAINHFTIDIQVGDRSDVYKGEIYDLAFEPVKRVVLEEMTGVTCINCPLGILSIEACEKAYGDRFIPISIHSYSGDRLGYEFEPYTAALGLNAAPSARINRINGIYSPMASNSVDYFYDMPEEKLWYNVVGEQLNVLAPLDVNVSACFNEAGDRIFINSGINYALNAEDQQLSLFTVLMEDKVDYYQDNQFFGVESPGLGEWGKGGIYGNSRSNFTHNDVVRGVVGQTFSGTIGLFPTTLKAGTPYSTDFSVAVPGTIINAENLKVAAIIIDSQTGQVLNAAVAPVKPYDPTGIQDVLSEDIVPVGASQGIFTIDGKRLQRITAPGLYIVGGKKVLIRK